jgi:Ca2+-binding RTX toxin-like protein
MVCVVPGLSRIHVKTLGGEDTVNNFSPAPVDVELGDGDDWAVLGGEPGITSSVLGGSGNDTIASGAGNDAIDGGPGADTVTLGAFTYPGLDPTLPYAGVAYPVVASLTSGTAQRWPLDTDTLAQVENLTSGEANDTLTGDGSANVLDSGAGRDTVDGRAGNDVLRGGADRDLIVGGTGADQVYGGYGDDDLLGGDGNDDLLGGDGDDRLYGEAGIDRLTGEVGLDRCYTGEAVSCELIL